MLLWNANTLLLSLFNLMIIIYSHQFHFVAMDSSFYLVPIKSKFIFK